jgi:hypothetical protein
MAAPVRLARGGVVWTVDVSVCLLEVGYVCFARGKETGAFVSGLTDIITFHARREGWDGRALPCRTVAVVLLPSLACALTDKLACCCDCVHKLHVPRQGLLNTTAWAVVYAHLTHHAGAWLGICSHFQHEGGLNCLPECPRSAEGGGSCAVLYSTLSRGFSGLHQLIDV